MSLLLAAMSLNILFQEKLTTDESTQDQQLAQALQITSEWAAKYRFQTASGSTSVLLPKPVLQWSNPEQGSVHGNVFLWTVQKRPLVIGSLFQWFSPFTHMSHEFHSLSEEALKVQRSGRLVWEPPPGIKFQRLTETRTIAETANGRQLQMRQIARSFRAKKHDPDGSVSREAELRLLPAPLYLYDTSDGATASGGLFVFVQGTDPELIVWLEAREWTSAKQWHVGFARMNRVQIRVLANSEEIWRAEQMSWGDIQSHRHPYTSFSSRNRPLE